MQEFGVQQEQQVQIDEEELQGIRAAMGVLESEEVDIGQ